MLTSYKIIVNNLYIYDYYMMTIYNMNSFYYSREANTDCNKVIKQEPVSQEIISNEISINRLNEIKQEPIKTEPQPIIPTRAKRKKMLNL